MTAYADLSEMINRHTGGNSGTPQNIFYWKDARVAGAAAPATVAGRMTSLWQYEGCPSHGAVPTTVAIPDNTTDGGLKQNDPSGGRQLWLSGGSLTANIAGTLILYDRLLHIGGLSGTSTSAQTVGGTLTRYTDGIGNMIWVEIYTQIGATGTTITASYTDQGGTSGQTTPGVSIGATGLREANRIIPLALAQGDYGVQAVASVTLAATTGTAGNFGINVVHPLLEIPIPAVGAGNIRDLISQLPSMVEIQTDACLGLAWLANTTTAPQLFGSIHMAER